MPTTSPFSIAVISSCGPVLAYDQPLILKLVQIRVGVRKAEMKTNATVNTRKFISQKYQKECKYLEERARYAKCIFFLALTASMETTALKLIGVVSWAKSDSK